MIIVKPVLEKKEDAGIAKNSARAPYFVFFEDDKFVKFVKNPFTVGGGAGFAAADLLKNEGCEKFLARKIGDNMKNKLEENNIVYEII